MSLKDNYEIYASPQLNTITPGAKVTYSCAQKYATISAANVPRAQFKWFCVLDRPVKKLFGKVQVIEGPYGMVWKDKEWETLGKHTIKCCITFPNGKRTILEYPQWVDEAEAVLGREIGKQKGADLPNPDVELSVITRYIGVLEEAEKFSPISEDRPKPGDDHPSKSMLYAMRKDELSGTERRKVENLKEEEGKSNKKLHDERIKQLKTHRDKLIERLSSTDREQRIPIVATHLETTTQQRTELRAFVAKVRTEPAEPERFEDTGTQRGFRRIPAKKQMEVWELVDWTNPTHQSLTGTYQGRGETNEKAIRYAIGAWDEGNEYPKGALMYEIPKVACETEIADTFETDGSSKWSSIRNFFEMVALGATVIAGIVTLLAPEPGSKVVSAAIWTCVFSSTTAAVINIGQRWDKGFSNWKEDSIDGLTILGNIFTAGQMQWIRRADVLIDTTRTGLSARGKAVRFALIGQVGTDGAQGVLIAVDYIGQYEAIMQDQSLTPEERSAKLLELFRSMTIDGVMTYWSMKGTKADLDNLKAGKIDTQKRDSLKEPYDPSKPPVDLTEPIKVKANTRDGRLVTKVQDEQVRLVKDTESVRTKFPEALPPKERGMRKKDDFYLSDAAKSGNIIIVRNSNPDALDHIGKPFRKPKPMELKAKTRAVEPNKGLAACDPNDQRLRKELRENGMTYDQYREKLKEQGFRVSGPEEGYIIKDNFGNAFYSDYDLHGVYKAETGQNAYDEAFQADLNRKFGEKIIQHPPHDLWPDRNIKEKAGPNRGPQPPVTAYMPDGSSVHLKTVEEMKKFYKENKINWKEIYPDD